MSPRYIIPMIAVLALCLSPVVLADDSDAETVDYGELYCYGDNPIIMQLFPETKSTWSVTSNGKEVPFDDNGDGSITIRLAGVDGKVTVTQTYNEDTAIQVLIPLHLPSSGDEDGTYTVTFHDGNSVIWTHEITNKTTVSAGDLHVITPSGPSKEGYIFNGWYTSPGFESESKFDPKVPVEGDILFNGTSVLKKRPDQICHIGISRTYQNIRLFSQMTVEENVEIGIHAVPQYSRLAAFLGLPIVRKVEREKEAKRKRSYKRNH